MGMLNQVSRIVDMTLTDKGREILALKDGAYLADLITQFAIFDDDINYHHVDFCSEPIDPNYPTFFTLEPVSAEQAHIYNSRLVTLRPGAGPKTTSGAKFRLIPIPPSSVQRQHPGDLGTEGLDVIDSIDPTDPDPPEDGPWIDPPQDPSILRVINATPSTANVYRDEPITVALTSNEFDANSGDPIFVKNTRYIVYVKDPSDSHHVELSEVVSK